MRISSQIDANHRAMLLGAIPPTLSRTPGEGLTRYLAAHRRHIMSSFFNHGGRLGGRQDGDMHRPRVHLCNARLEYAAEQIEAPTRAVGRNCAHQSLQPAGHFAGRYAFAASRDCGHDMPNALVGSAANSLGDGRAKRPEVSPGSPGNRGRFKGARAARPVGGQTGRPPMSCSVDSERVRAE